MSPALIYDLRVAEYRCVLTHRLEATPVLFRRLDRRPSVSDFRQIYLGEFGQTRRHLFAILCAESNVVLGTRHGR